MDQTSINREFVKHHFEAVNRRDVQTVLANMRPDLYDHELQGDHKNDLQEGAQRLQILMKQVPDLTVDNYSLNLSFNYTMLASRSETILVVMFTMSSSSNRIERKLRVFLTCELEIDFCSLSSQAESTVFNASIEGAKKYPPPVGITHSRSNVSVWDD